MSDPPPLPETSDPYELLGVDRDADRRTIKRAYTRLIRVYRPARHPDAFQRIRAAYESVRDRAPDDRAAPQRASPPAPPPRSAREPETPRAEEPEPDPSDGPERERDPLPPAQPTPQSPRTESRGEEPASEPAPPSEPPASPPEPQPRREPPPAPPPEPPPKPPPKPPPEPEPEPAPPRRRPEPTQLRRPRPRRITLPREPEELWGMRFLTEECRGRDTAAIRALEEGLAASETFLEWMWRCLDPLTLRRVLGRNTFGWKQLVAQGSPDIVGKAYRMRCDALLTSGGVTQLVQEIGTPSFRRAAMLDGSLRSAAVAVSCALLWTHPTSAEETLTRFAAEVEFDEQDEDYHTVFYAVREIAQEWAAWDGSRHAPEALHRYVALRHVLDDPDVLIEDLATDCAQRPDRYAEFLAHLVIACPNVVERLRESIERDALTDVATAPLPVAVSARVERTFAVLRRRVDLLPQRLLLDGLATACLLVFPLVAVSAAPIPIFLCLAGFVFPLVRLGRRAFSWTDYELTLRPALARLLVRTRVGVGFMEKRAAGIGAIRRILRRPVDPFRNEIEAFHLLRAMAHLR